MPRTTKRTTAVVLLVTGPQKAVAQAIADLQSNIDYDNLPVTVKEVSRD